MKSTTISLLTKNKCFCLKKEKVIAISKCDILNCYREKACRKKTNKDYDKSVKRNSERKGSVIDSDTDNKSKSKNKKQKKS